MAATSFSRGRGADLCEMRGWRERGNSMWMRAAIQIFDQWRSIASGFTIYRNAFYHTSDARLDCRDLLRQLPPGSGANAPRPCAAA